MPHLRHKSTFAMLMSHTGCQMWVLSPSLFSVVFSTPILLQSPLCGFGNLLLRLGTGNTVPVACLHRATDHLLDGIQRFVRQNGKRASAQLVYQLLKVSYWQAVFLLRLYHPVLTSQIKVFQPNTPTGLLKVENSTTQSSYAAKISLMV